MELSGGVERRWLNSLQSREERDLIGMVMLVLVCLSIWGENVNENETER